MIYRVSATSVKTHSQTFCASLFLPLLSLSTTSR